MVQLGDGGSGVFPTLLTNSIRCHCCGFIFSQLRPDDDEMARIYAGYRGAEYSRIRNLFEPGYDKFGDRIGNGQKETENRQAAMSDFLQDMVLPGSVKSVLDYGGDKGQHIPGMFADCEKTVFDISNIGVVDGVKIVNSMKMIDTVDFVMAANVFEHLSYPMQTMNDLRGVCHKNSYLFIDVPFELPEDDPTGEREQPNGFHEHINYFNQQSVTALLRCSGFKILKMETLALELGWNRSRAIFALAQTGLVRDRGKMTPLLR